MPRKYISVFSNLIGNICFQPLKIYLLFIEPIEDKKENGYKQIFIGQRKVVPIRNKL